MKQDIRKQTLQELEGQDWGISKDSTPMVIRCERLRRVPLEEMTSDNLRLMIGQQIGLEYLVPLALETLSANPLILVTYYPGDLLLAVIKVPDEFWHRHPELKQAVQSLVQQALALIDAGGTDETDEVDLLRMRQELSGHTS